MSKSSMIDRLAGFALGLLIGGALVYFASQRNKSVLPETDGGGSGRNRLGLVVTDTKPKPHSADLASESDTESQSPIEADYSERLLEAMSIPTEHDRLREFLILLKDMKPGDGPMFLNIFHQVDRSGGRHPIEWEAFITQWGEVDGAAAAKHFQENISEVWAQRTIASVLGGWARTDPEAAVEFINSAELPENVAESAIIGLITGVGKTSLKDAVALAVQNVPSDGETRLASRAMESIAETAVRQGGTEALLGAFGELPDPAWKKAAFGHVWWRLRHSDRGMASQWLVDNAESEWARRTQYEQTIQSMARDDPQGAMDWASSLPDELAAGQKQRTYNEWLEKDESAAAEWLGAQSPELVKLLGGE